MMNSRIETLIDLIAQQADSVADLIKAQELLQQHIDEWNAQDDDIYK